MDDTELLAVETPSAKATAEAAPLPPALEDSAADPAPASDGRSRTVPYGALAEERARRRELQRELQAAAATRERLQERLDALQALAARSEDQISAQAAPGDLGTGNVDAESVAAQSPNPSADDGFRTLVLQAVRAYAAERPDFLDAYQHARQARVEELSSLGYSQDEAIAITFDNEREVIQSAFAAGRNPAQTIYEFALRRGYRPETGGLTRAAGNSAALQPKPAGRALPTEAEKVALAARGQAGSKSLSAAGGGSTGTLTLEALADMSDEEFAEATKGDRWQRLLRG